jgi:DNA repair protein RadC
LRAPHILGAQHCSDQELLLSVLLLILDASQQGVTLRARETAQHLACAAGGIAGLAKYLHLSDEATSVRTTQARKRCKPLVLTAVERDRLAAIVELGRRVCRSPLTGRQLRSHSDIQAWATGRLTDLEHEEVWLLAVTAASVVCAECCVGKGGLHGCGLLPSDVLRPVLRLGAPAFVLVHNHPSGDPTPSREDIAMTKALNMACKTLGVILLDHVIVSRNGSSSLAESGLY